VSEPQNDWSHGMRLVPLAADYEVYRRQVIFECCKWDPQVGDVGTISDHACILSPETAAHLSRLAESLAAETLGLERSLARRPELMAHLGFGRRLRGALARADPDAAAVRVMRFDFHPTTDGWALSEVNSDVPGGFAEASALPSLAAAYTPNSVACGDVARALTSAMSDRLGSGARVAFVHATSYADDRQVMQFLADKFTLAGFACALIAPDHVRWSEGRALSIAAGQSGPIDAIVRFFPADWLLSLPRRSGWRGYFRSRTLMCNPPLALLSQSKRLPLVWDRLGVAVPTWRQVSPETRDPRDAPWRCDETWLVKPALGRVGEGVAWKGAVPHKAWRRIAREAASSPRNWVAQRRFQSRPLASRLGPRHVCISVFTVDGRASGFYGRLSANAIIEKHAQDAPVLILPAIGRRHAA
jgi:glutathionylspermidine synthase